jgi:hypothetical protein
VEILWKKGRKVVKIPAKPNEFNRIKSENTGKISQALGNPQFS